MEKKVRIQSIVKKNVLVILMLVLIVVMTVVNDNFLTSANLINILRNITAQGIMACGMTMVLISGEIDLSFGSTAGLAGLIVAIFCDRMQGMLGLDLACVIGILLALLAAAVVGAINAYWITKWRMPAMIATLAMQYVVYGIAGFISQGWPYYTFPDWFSVIGMKKVLNIPICVFIFVIMAAAYYILLSYGKFGRKVYAVGGNSESARLSGINVNRVKYTVMISNQLCAAVAGIVLSSQIMCAQSSLGAGTELTVVAAVVIGGTGVGGGKGKMGGTIVGLIFLGLIINAMTLANIAEYPQYIVKGVLILFAIVLNVLQARPERNRINNMRREE